MIKVWFFQEKENSYILIKKILIIKNDSEKTEYFKGNEENNFKFYGVRDLLYDGKIYISMILENSNGFTMNIYEADYNLQYLSFSIFLKKMNLPRNIPYKGGRLEKYKEKKYYLVWEQQKV